MNTTSPEPRPSGFRALLITQFLGAFNDNAFKLVVAFIAVDRFITVEGGSIFLSLAGILFSLPFFLFSTYAGYLADHHSKQKIIVAIKILEVAIMALGFFALLHGNMWFILFVLFLMGTHSALFSPSKYGILPEILPEEELSWGNGLIQMWTFAAIILGQACGGLLTQYAGAQIHYTAFVFIGVALLGVFTSLGVTKVKPSGAHRAFHWNFLSETIETLKWIKPQRGIFLSILGLMYFGFLGGVFHLNILLYARHLMGIEHFPLSFLLILLALGIGVGAGLAGKLSARKVEFGFVPLGVIGLSIFSLLLGFVFDSYFKVAACLFLLGLSAGFYIVPLNAYIQQAAPADRKGQVLAANNILGCLTGMFASVMIYVFKDVIRIDSAQIFMVLGIITSVGAVYICRLLPQAFVRLIVLFLTHTVYRIKIINKENIPLHGGALLVSNHVAMVDALMILASTPRMIRFMVGRSIYESKFWNPLLKLANGIPISNADKPKEIIEALNKAKEAIKNGELVCIFAEGQLTRTGNILKFNKGMERIMREVEKPIIPIHLDRIWGSIFSFEGGKIYSKWPKYLPYPVTVSVGKPMPSNASAFQVRQAVMELGAESFKHRLRDKMTLPEAFYKEARRHPFRFCVADSSGKKCTYGTTLIGAVAIADQLKKVLGDSKNIGVLLPPSVPAALANIGISLLNKVPINLNYTTSKEALDSILKQAQIKYVVTSRAFMEKAKLDLGGQLIFVEDTVKKISGAAKFKAFAKSFIMPDFMANQLIFAGSRRRSMEDLATIMFTSGSTGIPKGVMLTHSNIMSNLEGMYQVFHMKDSEVFLGVLPFFHSFGYTGSFWLPLISGMGAVYHYNPLDAKMVGKLVEEYKATVLMATPTFLNAYIRRCEPKEFATLRTVVVGAEKLKAPLAAAFQERYKLEAMEGYGATELSPICAINFPDFKQGDREQKAHKLGTIGMPLPGIAVKLVDPSTFDPVPEGAPGLILVKGPNVMKGYLNQEELTRQVIKDGWYVTGDIGSLDEDGFITITDRLSRFSKIGGEMVPHIKVEEAIHEVLHSSEPLAVVASVPDEKRGERIVVLHLKGMDVPAVVDGLRKSGLPNLWIPDEAAFKLIETIPLLGSGKVDLSKIKHMAREMFA